MPTITIDPTTIVTPEDFLKAWQFAVGVLHITAAKVIGVPSTPEGYAELVGMINEELTRRTGGLLYYGTQNFPPVTSNGSTILSAVQATDPSVVNTLSASPIDEVVTTGATAGSVIASTSTGTYSFVKKGVAIATALSLLGATLFAAQLTPEDKEDLEFTVEPFTDENGNVICYTDEEGTTYLPEDFIETIRQKLIQAGVYSGITPTPPPASDSFELSIQPLTAQQWMSIGDTYLKTAIEYAMADGGFDLSGRFHVFVNVVNVGPTHQAGFIFYRTADRNIVTVTKSSDFGQNALYTGLINISDRIQNDSGLLNQFVFLNLTTLNCGTGGGGGTSSPSYLYIPPATSSPYTLANADFLYMPYGISGSDGIPGIETDPNATLPSDASRLMSDYFADWYDNKKIFKTIEQDEDGNITGIGDVTFLPAGLTDTHGLDEDTTQTQSEAQDGDPVTDPSKLDDLLPAIKEFFERFIPTDPDTPSPTIPVNDSGDTPPAEPPVLSGSANGLWAIYNPTITQVQDFGSYLWSENILDQITRMFNSPIDAVIGFHMIYCTPIKGPTQNIKCGYLDTGVPSITVANQYATIDCGTVAIPEFYGTALDYSYTKLAVYLPFIGIVPLSTAVCMGSSLQIIYRIDVLTGTCLAQIKVIKENSDAVMYAFEGNCAVQIPLTATTYTGTVTALINSVSAGLSVFMGDYVSAGQDLSEAVAGVASKTGVKQSGSLGANAGVLGIRKPYVIITHPVAYDAVYYNTQYGYPINQTVTLGSLSGYTRVKDIHLSNIPCTDDELEQIENLLKDGVIIN